MRLYSGPLSLFSRKVEIALYEKGLDFERVEVTFTQTEGYSPKHPDVTAANPKGQVPVLVDGDLTLFDSTVILEYLEDAYPAPALYPADPREKARCRLVDWMPTRSSWPMCAGCSTAPSRRPRIPSGRRHARKKGAAATGTFSIISGG